MNKDDWIDLLLKIAIILFCLGFWWGIYRVWTKWGIRSEPDMFSKISGQELVLLEGNTLKANPVPVYLGKGIQTLGVITSYTKHETCPLKDCITASGKFADYNIIACPRTLPLGSFIEIDGIIYECGDRTNIKYDGRYDLWFGEDYYGALNFGKQVKEITIYQ